MELAFLKLPPEERGQYFAEAARRRGLSPVVLEKDFWVSWMLGILFRSKFKDELVFKGGTSLSKVFQVIDRFSEDIDLSLSPDSLGISETEVEKSSSRTQSQKWLARMEVACGEIVRAQMQPELELVAVAILGEREPAWFHFEIDAMTKSPVLLFHYPCLQPAGFDYLKRSVKMEFGSLTDQQPVGRHPIRPWVADAIPEAFGDWQCETVTLELERTFWEKTTILHVKHYRPAEKPTPDRFSRHYADTAALALYEVASRAVADDELRDRVVNWKSRFFGSGWARYDLAKPGTFRLVPPAERVPELRRDYQAMRDMYLSEPLDFDQILATLSDLEQRINAPTGA